LHHFYLFIFRPFFLPIQDLVAIPDFGTGAEENWGLIGFSVASVLYDPGKTSDSLQQGICETVVHELAHQVSGKLQLSMRKMKASPKARKKHRNTYLLE